MFEDAEEGARKDRRVPPKEHRWKKGQSGNPGGRPKGSGVTAALRKLLSQIHNGKRIEELVAERWVKEVLSGKHAHLQMLLERTEGKVTERAEVSAFGNMVFRVAPIRVVERLPPPGREPSDR